MKKVLIAVAAIAALPATTAQAQDVQMPGVYFGVEGGLNWMFNTTILGQNVSPADGMGPRWQDRLRLHRPARRGRRPLPREPERQLLRQPRHHRQDQPDIDHGQLPVRLQRDGRVRALYRRGCRCRPRRLRLPDEQHGVRLSGHPRRRLQLQPQSAFQPRRSLFRHDQSDGRRYLLEQQQHHRARRRPDQVRFGSAAAAPAAAGRWRRRRSWCSSTGTARTSPSRRWPRSSRRPTPSRPRATPASRRPATPTRRARKPTTWRCRCVAPTR